MRMMKRMLRFNKILRSKKSPAMTHALRAAAIAVIVMAFVVTAIRMFSREGSPVVTAKAAEPRAAAIATTGADVDPLEMPKAAAPRPAPVTIVGCLERDDERFKLKDTTGEDAPKARSWKSGFLHKSSASVVVTDPSNHAKLPSHVGQRVSVTGMLVDREMQVRSLQRVSASCTN
jgi:hypothetical protein